MCLSFLKYSDLSPKTHLFFYLAKIQTNDLGVGLARLIEILVNLSIYKRKTIIDMKLKNRLLLMDVLFIYSIKIQA